MKTGKLFIVAVALLWVGAAGTAGAAPDLAAGKAKFQQLCATCHGPAGKGDGPAGASLNPKPRDLSVTTKTDAELKTIMTKGGAAAGLSPTMPPMGATLSDPELANVIAFIRSLK